MTRQASTLQTEKHQPGELNSQKKYLRTALQTLLHYGGSALVLYLLFRLLPGGQVWQTLGRLPPQLWVMVLAGYLAAHCIGVAKWRLMVNLGGAGLNVWQGLGCFFAGGFGGLFFAAAVG